MGPSAPPPRARYRGSAVSLGRWGVARERSALFARLARSRVAPRSARVRAVARELIRLGFAHLREHSGSQQSTRWQMTRKRVRPITAHRGRRTRRAGRCVPQHADAELERDVVAARHAHRASGRTKATKHTSSSPHTHAAPALAPHPQARHARTRAAPVLATALLARLPSSRDEVARCYVLILARQRAHARRSRAVLPASVRTAAKRGSDARHPPPNLARRQNRGTGRGVEGPTGPRSDARRHLIETDVVASRQRATRTTLRLPTLAPSRPAIASTGPAVPPPRAARRSLSDQMISVSHPSAMSTRPLVSASTREHVLGQSRICVGFSGSS
ncbi:Hypothetical protein I5071_55840 [Sandaracinus amylolyticus]|nr:Hypothetical protein I5071_55840 [Sandaracinus amylolyticus]